MSRKLLSTSIVIFVLSLNACSDKDQAAIEKVVRPVRTVTVTLQNEIGGREFSGVVDADRKVDLAFRVGGSLKEIPVLQGDRVKQDQILAQLDQTDFEIQVKAQQAEYDRAKAEYERAKTLVERQLIAQADFEKIEAQYFVSEAQLEKSKQDLAYTTIRAPFEGYIASRYVDNFSEVSARTPIVTLMDLSSLVITIEVPESVMIKAQRENIRPDLYATFEGHEASQFPLSIKEIAAQPNAGTQTYPVILSLPPITTLNILPGMSAVVGVRPFEKESGALHVAYLPPQSVLEDSDGRYVYVAVPQDETQVEGRATIARKNVEVGDISPYGIEITHGLAEGDEVVTAGMSQITPDMHVALMAKN